MQDEDSLEADCDLGWREEEKQRVVFSVGMTLCADSSNWYLVIADSVFSPASKSRALVTTCAKVSVTKFSREMTSLPHLFYMMGG